jgi:hypothetical protein
MTVLTNLKAGLATNLATITGMRTSTQIPEQPQPPVAIITLNTINYDTTFGRGLDEYSFTVTVIVSRADGRNAQNLLDPYVASTGTLSVKSAIELDRSLGGYANDCRVTGLSTYGNLTIGETNYLAAEWSVTVFA